MRTAEGLQERLERATRAWWFFLIIVLVQFIPPVTTKNYDPSKLQDVIRHILANAYFNTESIRSLFPVFQVVAILMIAVSFLPNRWAWRLFAFYAGVFYIWVAVVQSVADTPAYGFCILSNSAAMFLAVSLAWFLEFGTVRTGLKSVKPRVWSLLYVLPALLAFWCPVSRTTHLPEFNPIFFLTSPAGTAFCLLTPAIISLMVLRYPNVNLVTFRMTCLVGLIIGFYNLPANFLVNVGVNWWNGVLHLPLLFISLFGVILGYRRVRAAGTTAGAGDSESSG